MRTSYYTIVLSSLFYLSSSFLQSTNAQEDQKERLQEQKTFNLNPDNLGALENSVNLFTGQVSFPMNLVSLPGRGGLNISVNLLYNSTGVNNQSKIWNVESPTSIVGLGWSMDIPKIICDHKLTGARADDDFYIVENGNSIKLICTDADAYVKKYVPENDNLWKIEYNNVSEKWIVTKENGYRYIYGDKNSNRGTVQWMVNWGNWIGSSTQPAGQGQMAYIWNISQVENLWGDKMTFTYDNDEEYVARNINNITTEKKHTKASYLKKIEDPTGKSVEFFYGKKLYEDNGIKEYQDPHEEQPEPDAYQEKFENRYLDRIIVRNENDSLLYELDLNYKQWIGEGELAKRLLTSIKKINPSGSSMPPVQFQYSTENGFLGYLKKVTNSYGAYYEYEHIESELPNSNLAITAEMPTPAGLWEEQYIYTGNNYVLVVWRTVNSDGSHNSGYRPCRMHLYTWDGRWHKQVLNEENINLKTVETLEKERALDWQIVLGENFFSFLYQENNSSYHRGRIYFRNELDGAEWNLQSLNIVYDSPRLLSGNEFVALAGLNEQEIRTYTFKGSTVTSTSFTVDEFSPELFLSAANNYIFVHNDNSTSQDYIYVFYLDEEKRWQKSAASTSNLFRTDDGSGFKTSYWHAFNSFAMGLPWDNQEYIYQWDDKYNNIKKITGWGNFADYSFVFGRQNSLIGISEVGGDGKSSRYNGSSWQFTDNYNNWSSKQISFGNDFIIRNLNARISPKEDYLREYDPNQRIWKPEVKYVNSDNLLYTPPREGNAGLVVEAGANMFMVGDGDIYKRDFNGEWIYLSQLDNYDTRGGCLVGHSVVINPDFLAYEYIGCGTIGDPAGSYITTIKNGKIDKKIRFQGLTYNSKTSHIGNDIVVQASSKKELIIRKVINGQASGFLSFPHISLLKWYDGNKSFYNCYDFDFSVAKSVPSGNSCFFNKVSVIQGSSTLAYRPYGHTDYYFFNGLTDNELIKTPLKSNSFNYNVGIGAIYEVNIIDSGNDTVSISKTEYDVFKKEIFNHDEKRIGIDYYLRPISVVSQIDGIETKESSKYNIITGLLESTQVENSTAVGAYERFTQQLTYWHDIYDPDNRINIFQPVQTTVIHYANSRKDTLSSLVNRWKKWDYTKWAPDKSYSWLRKGASFFSAWDYQTEPSSSQWKETSNILIRDPETGAPIETSDISGIKSSVIYDHTKTKPLATVFNAGINEIAYSGFEDLSHGGWIYEEDSVVPLNNSATGYKAFVASPGEIITDSIEPGTYKLSFWTKKGEPVITVENGEANTSGTYPKPDGWSLKIYEVNVSQSPGKIKILVDGIIDELRLYPTSAKMTTYTYNKYSSVVSETSSRNFTTYYEYDDQNRPCLVRDYQKNIIKRYSYRYRNEHKYKSALLSYSGNTKSGDSILFRLNHPKYHSGEVNYSWDFGDGTQAITDSSSIKHVYSSTGFFKAKATVKYLSEGSSVTDEKVVHINIPSDIKIIISGPTEATICFGTDDSEFLTFNVESISGGCEGYNYQWYIKSPSSEIQSGSSTQMSYTFTEIGPHEIYCKVKDTCGTIVYSDRLLLQIIPDFENCD